MISCPERSTVLGVRPKWTYVTHTTPAGAAAVATVGPHDGPGRGGDLVVANVERLGTHGHVENPHGRRVRLYSGDLVIGPYGNRYATNFYEGYVPTRREPICSPSAVSSELAAAYGAHADRWPPSPAKRPGSPIRTSRLRTEPRTGRRGDQRPYPAGARLPTVAT
jgi:hypothetical protein